tara:strand:- start:8 stop:253 length:246 start_codon:yes stop_codon:yes gene_type:complete
MDKTLSELKQAESLMDKAIESLYQAKKLLLNVENDDLYEEIRDLMRFVTDAQFAADKATYELYYSVMRQQKRVREAQHESS